MIELVKLSHEQGWGCTSTNKQCISYKEDIIFTYQLQGTPVAYRQHLLRSCPIPRHILCSMRIQHKPPRDLRLNWNR